MNVGGGYAHEFTTCEAASTADIGGTYSAGEDTGGLILPPGISGDGAVPVVDGVTLVASNNVLLKNQTNAASNGIWHVDDDGSGGSGWALGRVSNDYTNQWQNSAYVRSGDTHGGEYWWTPDDVDITYPEGATRWEPFPPPINGIIVVRAAAASTGNIAATYTNGSQDDGQGARLTKASAGALPAQDGVTLVVGDVLLVRAQTTAAQNGLYVVQVVGSGSVAFVLGRHHQQDMSGVLNGGLAYVIGGSTLAGTFHLQTAASPTVGTTNLTYQRLLLLTGPAPTVIGARDNSEMALANLLTALEDLGAIVDSTTPS